MIEKVVKKHLLHEHNEDKEDLQYWLSKTPEERIAAIEFLRRQAHGNTERLQRVARVVKLGEE